MFGVTNLIFSAVPRCVSMHPVAQLCTRHSLWDCTVLNKYKWINNTAFLDGSVILQDAAVVSLQLGCAHERFPIIWLTITFCAHCVHQLSAFVPSQCRCFLQSWILTLINQPPLLSVTLLLRSQLAAVSPPSVLLLLTPDLLSPPSFSFTLCLFL